MIDLLLEKGPAGLSKTPRGEMSAECRFELDDPRVSGFIPQKAVLPIMVSGYQR